MLIGTMLSAARIMMTRMTRMKMMYCDDLHGDDDYDLDSDDDDDDHGSGDNDSDDQYDSVCDDIHKRKMIS